MRPEHDRERVQRLAAAGLNPGQISRTTGIPRSTLREWLAPRIVAERPAAWWFIRGLIHSDGCRVINRVNGAAHPRYFFTQVSTDIQEIFCEACDRLDIEYRHNRWNSISIARRGSVAMMDSIVGPKT